MSVGKMVGCHFKSKNGGPVPKWIYKIEIFGFQHFVEQVGFLNETSVLFIYKLLYKVFMEVNNFHTATKLIWKWTLQLILERDSNTFQNVELFFLLRPPRIRWKCHFFKILFSWGGRGISPFSREFASKLDGNLNVRRMRRESSNVHVCTYKGDII